ncbi:hypothetical protein Slin15195_G079580 [Septoria linicola]|uniref:Uncharacterized protein n=1 Tax=Septoria linicola TaxID=215465 RepID=A0A9Q9ATU1_9PEZI|nr:hypothetical protein Slin14017_G040780 [Septoria linicola]USW54639.1 hypothetical protein Slin15195_G079580 [Septoria linicola]
MLALVYAFVAALLLAHTHASKFPTDAFTKKHIYVDLFHYEDNDCQTVVGKKKTIEGGHNAVNKCWSVKEPFHSYFYDLAKLRKHQLKVPRALHGNCDWRDGCGNPRTDIYLTDHGICTIEVYPNTKCLGRPIHTHHKANWPLNTHKCITNFWTNPKQNEREPGLAFKISCKRPGAEIYKNDLVGDPLAYNFCPAGPPDIYNTTLTEDHGKKYFFPDEGYEPLTKSCEGKGGSSSKTEELEGPVMTTISTVVVVPVSALTTKSSAVTSGTLSGSTVVIPETPNTPATALASKSSAVTASLSSLPSASTTLISETSSTTPTTKTKFSTVWVAPLDESTTAQPSSSKQ